MTIKAKSQTATCPECSGEIPAGAKFCPECGFKIPPPPAPKEEQAPAGWPPILTTEQVADLLQTTRWTVYELCMQQRMPFFWMGKRRRFRTADILEWAGQQTKITTAG